MDENSNKEQIQNFENNDSSRSKVLEDNTTSKNSVQLIIIIMVLFIILGFILGGIYIYLNQNGDENILSNDNSNFIENSDYLPEILIDNSSNEVIQLVEEQSYNIFKVNIKSLKCNNDFVNDLEFENCEEKIRNNYFNNYTYVACVYNEVPNSILDCKDEYFPGEYFFNLYILKEPIIDFTMKNIWFGYYGMESVQCYNGHLEGQNINHIYCDGQMEFTQDAVIDNEGNILTSKKIDYYDIVLEIENSNLIVNNLNSSFN